jgi:hypothetical protein
MSRTDVDLANAALGYLLRDTLRNLDGSDVATVKIKANMQQAKEHVIEEYDWPECREIAPLVVAADTVGTYGWSYAYLAPPDMIKPWLLGEENATKTTPFARGMSSDITSDTQYFFTNLGSAYLRYGSSRAPIGRFSAQVFDLMARQLAILCCMSLTKETKLHQYLSVQYDKTLSKVKTSVANGEPEVIDLDFVPETIAVRSQ